jgi:hypothetical protein
MVNFETFTVKEKKDFLSVRLFEGEQCVANLNCKKKVALELGLAIRNEAQK